MSGPLHMDRNSIFLENPNRVKRTRTFWSKTCNPCMVSITHTAKKLQFEVRLDGPPPLYKQIRASNTSGECSFNMEVRRGHLKWGGQQKECVKRRAELSLKATPECSDKASLSVGEVKFVLELGSRERGSQRAAVSQVVVIDNGSEWHIHVLVQCCGQ